MEFARDLNPIVLGTLGAAVGAAMGMAVFRTLRMQDDTFEAADEVVAVIVPAELTELMAHGDRANALAHQLKDLAVAHFEADPLKDALTPAQVFHLANEPVSKPTFEEFAAEFEAFLKITRKYKLALDRKAQQALQKIYFAWDPSGNAMQVKPGNRYWTVDVKPKVEALLEAQGAPIPTTT